MKTSKFPSFIVAGASLMVSILLTPVEPAWAGASQSLFCSGTTKRKAGTLLNIDADLAIEKVKRKFPNLPVTRVAVIDSGFDPSMQAFFANPVVVKPALSASVWTKLQFWKNDPNVASYTSHIERDEVGHGTAVSALIGAKGGIGVDPYVRITMYKATDADSSSFREDALKSAIQAACNDGNEIINMSLGGQLDEMNFASVTQGLDGWLNSKGCQVVAAAGNAGVDNSKTPKLVHDGVIKVGALTRTNAKSRLTSGEIAAVGIYAYTLAARGSDFTKFEKESSFHCGSDPRFVMLPGTSFSTPQVTGVLALIRSILKTSPQFAKLSIAKQLRLQKDILKFSAIPVGQVNALRAVAVASAALRTDLNDRAAIVRAFRSDVAAERLLSTNECRDLNDLACVDAKRAAAAYGLSRDESLTSLAHIAARETNYELFFSTVRGLSKEARPAFAKEAEAALNRLRASPFELMAYYADYREIFGRRITKFELGLRRILPQAVAKFRDGDPAQIQFWADATKLNLVDNTLLESVIAASRTQTQAYPLLVLILKTSPKISFPSTIAALREFVAASDRDVRNQVAELLKKDPKQDRKKLQLAIQQTRETNQAIAIVSLSQSGFSDGVALETYLRGVVKPSSDSISSAVLNVLVERPVRGREDWIAQILSKTNQPGDLLISLDLDKLMAISKSRVPEWTLALTKQWHAPLSNYVLASYITKEPAFTDVQRLSFFNEMAKTLVRPDVKARANYDVIRNGAAHVISGLQDVRTRAPSAEITKTIQGLKMLLPADLRPLFN